MGKSTLLKMFQKARLAQWIGDFEEAELLYSEIEHSHGGLAYILKPATKIRKKKLEGIYSKHEIPLLNERNVLIEDDKYFEQHIIQPKTIKYFDKKYQELMWEYSASIVGKNEDAIRLEIRGYNPNGTIPRLHNNIFIESPYWSLKEVRIEPENSKPDLLNILAYSEDPEIKLSLSVDCWGLLTGTAITYESEIGDTLAKIHIFLCELGRNLWYID